MLSGIQYFNFAMETISRQKRWVAKPAANEELFHRLKEQIQTNDILLRLIAQRNITSLSEAHSYFLPSFDALHSPFLMKDMDKAVAKIHEAIEGQKQIVIYGDYDVDGTTSVALVFSFFQKIHKQILYYIPDRFTEGYGISQKGIDWAAENGTSLIIALDCGIKSIENIEYAHSKGIEFIICDHHTPGDTIPTAAAVLNPKQAGCPYPYKELSGCGIGLKLVWAYAEYFHMDWNPDEYLGLVAVSIAADIVHMTGENRILTYFGLKKINENPRPGFKALMDISGAKKNMDVNDLVFRIGPRINAAGRIASGNLAVKMLIEESYEKALEFAQEINKTNTDRRSVDQIITKEALEMIESLDENIHRKTTVLFNPSWHKGVIGIVASRLIDKYYRPTILLTESNGMAVGSGRSVPGFDLYQAIKQCDTLLDQWGGHQAAAGLSLRLDNISAFAEKFEEAVSNSITDEQLTPVLEYDMEIGLDDITPTFCRSIERFGPFGPESMKPVFASRNISCAYKPKLVGNNHLQISLRSSKGNIYKGIAFGLGALYEEILKTSKFDICYTVEPNEYRGDYMVSINIKDIQIQN
jgi:single-stranded-DNA-specific exonuclease